MSPKLWRAGPLQLEFVAPDGRFLGIGAVTCNHVPLRCPSRPWFATVATPDAARMTDWRVVSDQRHGEAMTLALRGSVARSPGAPMTWMLHETRPRLAMTDWTATPKPDAHSTLHFDLAPASRRLGQVEAHGFSYRFRFHSRDLPIYQLLDHGTWEPGGSATDCTIWLRGATPAVTTIRQPQQRFSTEWYLPTAGNPSIYQFFPLQSHLQGFTFTASPHGVVITWATRPAHIRTLLQKTAEYDQIEHWHEHSGDLSGDFETAPVEVLFVPGPRRRHELIDLYHAVREMVADTLHAAAGLRRERVTTLGMIEQWQDADLAHYATAGLPALAAAGIRRIALANHFRNHQNVLGVPNMCCTLDLAPVDTTGEQQLRGFCAAAAVRGVEVEMWANTAISTLGLMLARSMQTHVDSLLHGAAPTLRMLDATPDAFVTTPSGAMDADHYTPLFAVLNLRNEIVRTWWRNRWQHARQHLGLTGVFLDSSFNLSSDKFHYRPRINTKSSAGCTIDHAGVLGHLRPETAPPARIDSMFLAHLDLIRDFQQMGYTYSGEDCGVFGVGRCGAADYVTIDSVHLWSDCIAHFDAAAARARGDDPDDLFFRGLAYRLVWLLCWDPGSGHLTWRQCRWTGAQDSPTPQQLKLLGIFGSCVQQMNVPRTLPDNAGVRYETDAEEGLLWAFTDHAHACGRNARVEDLVSGEVHHGAQFPARRHHVYRILPPTP